MGRVKEIVIEAEDEGYHSAISEKMLEDNPYDALSLGWQAWRKGFEQGLLESIVIRKEMYGQDKGTKQSSS